MKVYYFVSHPERLTLAIKRVFKILNDAGFLVLSNVQKFNVAVSDPREVERLKRSGEMMINKIGGMIIEGTYPSNEIGYLIAMTLVQKKPVLYLKENKRPLDKALRYLLTDKKLGRYFRFENYTADNIKDIMLEFINSVEDREENEAASIKYTLRITPRLDRYLTWKAKRTKMSKADFLRDGLLLKALKEDEQYSKYFSSKRDKRDKRNKRTSNNR